MVEQSDELLASSEFPVPTSSDDIARSSSNWIDAFLFPPSATIMSFLAASQSMSEEQSSLLFAIGISKKIGN